MKEIFSVFSVYDKKTKTKEIYCNLGENCVIYFSPIVWNTMLPEKLKNCDTLEEYKDSTR